MNLAQRLAAIGKRLQVGERDALRAGDPSFREVSRACRAELAAQIDAQLGPFDPRLLRALRDVPRELFVRAEDLDRSADDIPLPLDDLGLATISAPHAYLLSFRLLELAPGDRLVELGTGTGYGAALAATVVGDEGQVTTVEIDARLATLARELLAPYAGVRCIHADAVESAAAWTGAKKIVCTFAVDALPQAWVDAIPEGGALVAPVGSRERNQVLTRVMRVNGALASSSHGGVRYVKNRSLR